jgi:hypothetical protein
MSHWTLAGEKSFRSSVRWFRGDRKHRAFDAGACRRAPQAITEEIAGGASALIPRHQELSTGRGLSLALPV